MALSGSANKRLVSSLIDAGVAAIGLSGEDGSLLTADPLDPERYGHVGTPSGVNAELLHRIMSAGFLPVVSPVSRSTDRAFGATLNVNGDDAAALHQVLEGLAIAAALDAEELLLVSDVAGVLLDEQTVVSLGPEDAQRLIDDGTARGGMAAKLQAALSALAGLTLGTLAVLLALPAAYSQPARTEPVLGVGDDPTPLKVEEELIDIGKR